MTYSKRNYDYFRIFFHRPILTELNVLFWKFLSVSAIVFLSLTLLSVRYYNHYPLHHIKNNLKQAYLNRIVSFYGNVALPKPPEDAPTSMMPRVNDFYTDNPRPEETVEEAEAEREFTAKETANAEKPAKGRPSGGKGAPQISAKTPASKKKHDASVVASLDPSSRTSANMQNAIGSIASKVTPSSPESRSPMEPYNARKKAYESSVKELSRAENDNIDIAGSQFTDFDIVTGLRDYEKTIATSNENKRSVRHCIDRISRSDPTLRGNLVVKFDIHPEGYVIPQSIQVLHSDIQDVLILNCIKRTIRRWRNFPRVPYEMGEYSITQKYVF